SLATARLVEDRHDYILTTIASSTTLATYTEKEKAEWGDFLSCNNRLLELIASKEQEESALTTDIHDFRCTASTYVSLASKVKPTVDADNGVKDSFLKAAEMLEIEAQL